MTQQLTKDEVVAILTNVSDGIKPAVKRGLRLGISIVVKKAKENCTPGKSPYASMWFPTKAAKAEKLGNSYTGAPYSYDNDPARLPVHMRDMITGQVVETNDAIVAVVGVKDSEEGGDHHYAVDVHDGTTKMWARPFLLDAIIEKHNDILMAISEELETNILQNCEGDLFSGPRDDLPTVFNVDEGDE
jgi:hypothetical protein